MNASPVIIAVRHGEPTFSESWVYVWLRHRDRAVTYVGATGLPPALRTWLHLTDADPAVGRVVARYRDAGLDIGEDHDVLAFAMPPTVERSHVKDVLISRLVIRGQLAADHVCDGSTQVALNAATAATVEQIADAIDRRAAELSASSR